MSVNPQTFARPLAQRNEIWRNDLSVPVSGSNEDDMIDLTASYVMGAPPVHIGEAARAALERGETHYVDRLGIKPLREAIAGRRRA